MIDEVSQNQDTSACMLNLSEEVDEALTKLEDAIIKQPLHREIYYKLLVLCTDLKTTCELEEAIAAMPEFASAVQDQYWLISRMVEFNGLDKFYIDFNDNIVEQERVDSMSEDELFECVKDEAFKTTELGQMVVRIHSPRKRLERLLEQVPARKETYLEVLDFINGTPRQYKELQDLLKDNPILLIDAQYEQFIQPSVFIDKLEQTGIIEWQGGWILSQNGQDILQKLKQHPSSK